MIEITQNIQFSSCLLAVSGGADSMAMLHMMRNHPNIHVAHVNHGLRHDSYMDQQLVHDFCNTHNIKFHTITLSNPPVSGFEQWARTERYNFFDKLVKQYNLKYILTAHNANDQSETIIMRIIRGTGLKGLRGIHRENGNIIRPLIDVTKKEIYQYCTDNNVPYREDYTNKDIKYFRNRVRHTLSDKMNHIQLCNIANMAQNIYPKILTVLKTEYLPSIKIEQNKITIPRTIPLNDLTCMLIADILEPWVSLSSGSYDSIKSNDPQYNVINLGNNIICDKKSPKHIRFIKKCKL